ncbi:MAG TPA: FMN-binding glutamate synthase family protein [Flavobacteriales bacterium]
MRKLFYAISLFLIALVGLIGYWHPIVLWWYVVLIPLVVVGIINVFQEKHTIMRNFPVLGYARYFFEFISPEMQQYFIERTTDGRPFSRQQRALIYRRAKNVNDTVPFGTQLDLYNGDYEGLRHSIFPAPLLNEPPRVRFGGPKCTQPYEASLLNISAMSFGSLSENAVKALNGGARKGGFFHNTGEGGLSDHHLAPGGDVVWQIGTGYFSCRTATGTFDPELFRQKAAHPQVRMIELKLSQGAKPGHGGVLPAAKNTPEVARIRHITPYTTVLSPPGHSAFSDADGLLRFVEQLRELSGGKPVGFKLCIGKAEEFTEICKLMRSTGMMPDFITVDGAEGGTGAAPLEFTDSVGMPIVPALMFVSASLRHYGLKEHIRVIASGKVASAADLLKMLALGADTCNSARGFMFSLGCIQALRCNTNDCPAGVATQDKGLQRGLVITDKTERVYHFHRNTLHAAMELLAACGKKDFSEVGMDMFSRGDEFIRLADHYFPDHLVNVIHKELED